MGDSDFGSGGGMAGQHPLPLNPPPLKVAPTDADGFNTIRIPLVAVACWRLNAPAFAFDSSFPAPDFAPEFTKLASVVQANPGCPASLFAHADPAGSDDVNKVISDRRAISIYATITRQPDLWEDLYSNSYDRETWGTKAIQTMLATLTDGSGTPYYTDTIDDKYGQHTSEAVQRFQTDAGKNPSGQADRDTRRVLFGAYMDVLCRDGSGARFQMQPSDFMGGGADPGGKMAYQGCSRFNPVVLLSNDDMAGDRGVRNDKDAPNRRVVVFLFRPRKTTPSEWPCPRVKEPADACRAQFWPDGEQRRQNGPQARLYKDTRDTMACRFYDRQARRSPCEGAKTMMELHIRLFDACSRALPDAPYRIRASGKEYTGTADGSGLAIVKRVPGPLESCDVEWNHAGNPLQSGSSEFSMTVLVSLPGTGTRQRLCNLGYTDGTEDEALDAFKTDYGLQGASESAVLDTLRSVHDSASPKAPVASAPPGPAGS
jgi:hypothetical protein